MRTRGSHLCVFFTVPRRMYLNLKFHRDEVKCQPDLKFISEIHSQWAGDFDQLEEGHHYIQWLFPLHEGSGVNALAHPLTEEEAELMRNCKLTGQNLVKSYKMMLDFYGMKIQHETTGKCASFS